MGEFGRLSSLKDVPPKATLAGYVRKAMKLNEDGVKVVRAKAGPKQARAHAEGAHRRAREARRRAGDLRGVQPQPPPRVREWIAEAKGEATRQRRLDTTIQWLAEGKSRNWKYAKC